MPRTSAPAFSGIPVVNARKTRQASAADRAIGPALSSDQHSGIAPSSGTTPNVGRRPVVPQRIDGETIEPNVSVPIANGTQPAATAEHGPALDPLDPSAGLHWLLVRPPNQVSPMASSPRESLATRTAPESDSVRTTAESVFGTRSL